MAHKSKILNIREEYDGTISSIPDVSGINQVLEYCTDETNDQNICRKHKVFENDYRNIDQTLAYNKSDDYYIRSIVGWTSTNERLRLVCPPITYSGRKQLYENIFPVVVAQNDTPVTSLSLTGNEVFSQWIQNFYIVGHFYLVLGKSKFNRETLKIRIGKNGRPFDVNEWEAKLLVCRLKKDIKVYNRCDPIDRILDRYRNPTDYDVFGMYAGGPEYEMTFQGKQRRRLCYDHRIPVTDESGWDVLNSRYEETFKWYGRDKKSGFRTEPSYDWRFRRVGFYCSLNSLLVVEEELDQHFFSLLRESTFVICDAMVGFEIMGEDRTKVIRDPVKQRLCLGPLVAVITEGLYRIAVKVCDISAERRNVYFYLRPHDCRPLFLHWLDFESDFNPIGPTVDPYVKIQHRLRVLMKEEEFFDFVIFEDILVDNQGNKGTIACILEKQPNVSKQQSEFFNVTWHFYRKIPQLEYYCYLSSHYLSSSSRGGIFVRPLINPEPLVFPSNVIIDWNEYSELNDNEHQLINSERQSYDNWWQTNATNISTDRTFHNSCLFHLSTILQLREPTTNAIMRAIKTERFHFKVKNRQQYDHNNLERHRPYLNRFRQVVSGNTLYDWQAFKKSRDKKEPLILAFVMYDFPEVRNNGDEIIDKWDVYGSISPEGTEGVDEDYKKCLFHYLGSVSCGYNYIPNDPQKKFWKRNAIEVFDMLKREKGINEYWFQYWHPKQIQDKAFLTQKAKDLEAIWENESKKKRRTEILEELLGRLMPYNCPVDTKLLNQTYFGKFRLSMFTDPKGGPRPNLKWDQATHNFKNT